MALNSKKDTVMTAARYVQRIFFKHTWRFLVLKHN